MTTELLRSMRRAANDVTSSLHALGARAPVLMLCLVLACSTGAYGRKGDQLDVSNYPPDIQAAYHVFASRCSRCHSLARPLSSNITDKQQWVRYVKRMSLQPGSGIGPHNSGEILRFLLYYTELQAGKHLTGASSESDSNLDELEPSPNALTEQHPENRANESKNPPAMKNPSTDSPPIAFPPAAPIDRLSAEPTAPPPPPVPQQTTAKGELGAELGTPAEATTELEPAPVAPISPPIADADAGVPSTPPSAPSPGGQL